MNISLLNMAEHNKYGKEDNRDNLHKQLCVSRSERVALASNQAADHALRTVLKTIDNMQQAALQAHNYDRCQFLGSVHCDNIEKNDYSTSKRNSGNGKTSMEDLSPAQLNKERISRSIPGVKLPQLAGSNKCIVGSPGSGSSGSTEFLDSLSVYSNLSRQPSEENMLRVSPVSSASVSCPTSPALRQKYKMYKQINASDIPINFRERSSSFNDAEYKKYKAHIVKKQSSLSTNNDKTNLNDLENKKSNSFDSCSYGKISKGICKTNLRSSSFGPADYVKESSKGSQTPEQVRARVERQIRIQRGGRNVQRSHTFSGKDSSLMPCKAQLCHTSDDKLDRPKFNNNDISSVSPYSISSSMKLSSSSGTFEKQTGKHGLEAWMGKSPKSKPKQKIFP